MELLGRGLEVGRDRRLRQRRRRRRLRLGIGLRLLGRRWRRRLRGVAPEWGLPFLERDAEAGELSLDLVDDAFALVEPFALGLGERQLGGGLTLAALRLAESLDERPLALLELPLPRVELRSVRAAPRLAPGPAELLLQALAQLLELALPLGDALRALAQLALHLLDRREQVLVRRPHLGPFAHDESVAVFAGSGNRRLVLSRPLFDPVDDGVAAVHTRGHAVHPGGCPMRDAWERLRSTLPAAAATVACAGAMVVAVPGASAGVDPNWAAGQEVTLPADAGTNPDVSLLGVSCGAPGSCTAVGDYHDAGLFLRALLADESSGAWGGGSEATLPAGANATPNAYLTSVSCPAARSCVAVGGYTDSAGSQEGLILSESSGAWSPLEATPPSDGNTTPDVGLSAVSCPSAGNCVAVGFYEDTSSHRQAMVLTESSGTWSRAVKVAAPGVTATDPSAGLEHVSCSSAGNCTAVGLYMDLTSNFQSMLVTESSGTWGAAVSATLPAGAVSSTLYSLSCSSPGNCAAVGFYTDGTGAHAVLLDESSGSWAAAVTPGLPAGGKDASLDSVSCPADGGCVAAGAFIDTSNHSQGLLVSQSAGSWQTGVEVLLPVNAGANPQAGLGAVSCTAAGSCVAVGEYYDSSVQRDGLMVSESSGVWRTGVELTAPAAVTSPFGVVLNSVSCASAGDCAASGIFQDGSGHYQGLVVAADPATPSLAVSAPATATVGGAIAGSSVAGTLSGGADPTGTVTFTVFGPSASPPSSCGSGGVSLGSAQVSGDETYHPADAFTPAAPGDYWWYASYDGDPGDNAVGSACGASMPETVVALPKLVVGRAKVAGSSARIRLACVGPVGARCRASLRLAVTEIRKGKKVLRVIAAERKRKVVAVASAKAALAGGQAKTLRLELNAKGRRLLVRFHRLPSRLKVLASGKTVASRVVTFRAPRHRHKKRR